jgi:hypothetical protein
MDGKYDLEAERKEAWNTETVGDIMAEDDEFEVENNEVEPIEIILVSRIKNLQKTEEYQTGGTGFKVKTGLLKKEATERGVPPISLNLTLNNRSDFEQVFEGIGPSGLFEIKITPLAE